MKDYIYLIDKPKGISSFKAINNLKYSNKNILKIGHAGTLDPMAEGLLITMINGATKLSDDLMHLNKIYEVVMIIGYETDTLDLEGNIINYSNEDIELDNIHKIISSFIGDIKQIPPKYSAIKINGKKSYQLARNNVEFEIKERNVKIYDIYDINILSDEIASQYEDDKYKVDKALIKRVISFKTKVSSGTYIRSLVRDIGYKLNSYATMCYLKRLQIDNFELKNKNRPIGLNTIYSNKIDILDKKKIINLLNGQQIILKYDYKKDEIINIYYNNNFIGLIKVIENINGKVLVKKYKYINKEIL